MNLITSFTAKGEEVVVAKSQKVAEEDIVVTNELGQNVVVVAKGHPIPDDFDEETAASSTVPIRQADEEEPVEEEESQPAKKGRAAPENKKA